MPGITAVSFFLKLCYKNFQIGNISGQVTMAKNHIEVSEGYRQASHLQVLPEAFY